MSEVKFLYCEHCKKIVIELSETKVPVMCCGQKMQALTPNSTEAAVEKHLPAVEISGNTVKVSVSTVEHPMLEAHYIDWVCVQTEQGVQVKKLEVGKKPEATFALAEGDKVVAVYEYCNLHGLWKTEV